MRHQFIGPLQPILSGNNFVDRVETTTCLGAELDSNLNWNVHVRKLITSFAQKLSLLRSLYFLPISARTYFYFKVTLPSVTYALVVWSSCGKCLFDELERNWCTPSDEVLVNCNWFTIKRLYELRLLLLAHNCFYDLSPEPVKQLFTKYNSNYNLRRKLTFTQPKPNAEFLRRKIYLL